MASSKKPSPLDRVLGRLGSLDPVNLANLAQRLARERGLFEGIFNALQDGVLVADADGRIEYANAAARPCPKPSEARRDLGAAPPPVEPGRRRRNLHLPARSHPGRTPPESPSVLDCGSPLPPSGDEARSTAAAHHLGLPPSRLLQLAIFKA
jgi:hypothetical protein